MEEKEIRAGTIVHVYGFPVELSEAVKVRTFTNNWSLIENAARAEGWLVTSDGAPANREPPRASERHE